MEAAEAATVTVMDWRGIGVLMTFIVVWSGIMFWAAKSMLSNLEVKLDGHVGEFRSLQAELKELQITLPKDYVRREDWIRFGAGIDAKIDRLHDRLDEIKG